MVSVGVLSPVATDDPTDDEDELSSMGDVDVKSTDKDRCNVPEDMV